MNEKYKLNKEWLDLLLEHKNNENVTFNLSNNDIRILLTYIEVLQQENARLKENNMSMQEEMVRTWEKADLYKEVIEEVREYIKEKQKIQYKFALSHIECDDLLQILDILKEK